MTNYLGKIRYIHRIRWYSMVIHVVILLCHMMLAFAPSALRLCLSHVCFLLYVQLTLNEHSLIEMIYTFKWWSAELSSTIFDSADFIANKHPYRSYCWFSKDFHSASILIGVKKKWRKWQICKKVTNESAENWSWSCLVLSCPGEVGEGRFDTWEVFSNNPFFFHSAL